MTDKTSQPSPAKDTPGGQVDQNLMYVEPLDPASQALSDALRKSFRILKLLMLVLLVLYVFSGFFTVKPNEVGLVLRYGRVIGTGTSGISRDAVLESGWHWSWPYPFERWITIPTSPREIDVSFMYRLSERELATGIKGYKYNNLSPLRDDYLITGDTNILHASVKVRYRITDPVAYSTNIFPQPRSDQSGRRSESEEYPEYQVLSNLVRDSVIETAAHRKALKIRGEEQSEFLFAVANRVGERLKILEKEGLSLGITLDPETGIIAPKKSEVEAIMPPRQTQEAFDNVVSEQSKKSVKITNARADREALLVTTAGPQYAQIASAIDNEFELMLELSRLESQSRQAANPTASPAANLAETKRVRQAMEAQRAVTEDLLVHSSSGNVKSILRDAEIARDGIIKEATGDYDRFMAVLPEYLQHPEVFRSRLLEEAYAWCLNNDGISKVYVPKDGLEHRLHIYRNDNPMNAKKKKKKKKESDSLPMTRAARR